MAFLGLITLLMAPLGDSLAGMTILLAALGLFLYSDQPILTASAMDIVREGTAATTLGLLSTARFIFSAASPIIAGWLYSIDANNLFYYTAALYVGAIILLLIVRLPRPAFVEDDHDSHDHGGHGQHGAHAEHGQGEHGHDHGAHAEHEQGEHGHDHGAHAEHDHGEHGHDHGADAEHGQGEHGHDHGEHGHGDEPHRH